jgi:hypothetical protein
MKFQEKHDWMFKKHEINCFCELINNLEILIYFSYVHFFLHFLPSLYLLEYMVLLFLLSICRTLMGYDYMSSKGVKKRFTRLQVWSILLFWFGAKKSSNSFVCTNCGIVACLQWTSITLASSYNIEVCGVYL